MAKKLTPAKNKAWNSFSKFIRTRDCLKTTGTPDEGVCVTCPRKYPFKQLQAGHFIAGRTNSILFDEEATHAQCYGCNVGRGGAHVEYFIFMEDTYGREKIDELRRKKSETVIYKAHDYERIKEEYDQKTKELLANFT